MDQSTVLRKIPKIDVLLRRPELQGLSLPSPEVTELVRQEVASVRSAILSGEFTQALSQDALCEKILVRVRKFISPSMKEVINGTGIPLHTNLGRACLSQKAAEAAKLAACSYSTLEYDLETGCRGSRHDHVEQLLCFLTGAESAMVVNNNAAAVLLLLSAVGAGGEVITSRGELVEIGGSFRIPDIMEQCGCRLREVGATNKTHLRDYENAIGEQTKALLKVHTSNYRIVGFSEAPALDELVSLGRKNNLPVIQDLGSGCLIPLTPLGIVDEPTVIDSVKAGVDLISFSGDKLLGGPQAGIIIGRKNWIQKLKNHPLARAVRVDKMTLAALESTLRSYLNPENAVEEIPTLRMLFAGPEMLKEKAQKLCALFVQQNIPAEVIPVDGQVGGGSLPCQVLSSYGVSVSPAIKSVQQLEYTLRMLKKPIIGRISHEKYILDVRTLWEEDFPYLADSLAEAFK